MAEETPAPDAPKSDHDVLEHVIQQLRSADRTDNQESITITLAADEADAMADALEQVMDKLPHGRAHARGAAQAEAEKK
jgi:hypothetical protein